MKPQSLMLSVLGALASGVTAFQKLCKCECLSQDSAPPPPQIFSLPSCDLCTKQACLKATADFCTDVNLRLSCYQVESLKDMFIIYSFVLVVAGLLGASVYRQYWR
ncbi:hypothetical protein CANTEDRAFT_116300 [Yamadazyma tenuis ATCC 10573]|uniref:Membrane anchor Opy2 N-terminal domain-containing protein n=1 Tax=Candida tenuis (strain ATCC 10573 / BCRC 21748 / CBS 615 / JCM 9827 / NBRC 10315 / NRRL Y-1498 / VKM Y-70) TaxID=590646 RepID=G3BCZ2_CANTC|nr:uncharacterized protein CANTEDRAFT_116300 [Yamadazyma tenuis ATCC 10573]EGV60243.1 hypothetical protein CANTEDRAFT_116300 [Yamadazyma tenuis ATCC 10573]